VCVCLESVVACRHRPVCTRMNGCKESDRVHACKHVHCQHASVQVCFFHDMQPFVLVFFIHISDVSNELSRCIPHKKNKKCKHALEHLGTGDGCCVGACGGESQKN